MKAPADDQLDDLGDDLGDPIFQSGMRIASEIRIAMLTGRARRRDSTVQRLRTGTRA